MDAHHREGEAPPIHDLPWGSHACLLYESRETLLSSLAAFFRTGLRRNELCLWVTSDPLPPDEARALLLRRAPPLERFTRSGQLEIRDARSWYAGRGGLAAGEVLAAWTELEKHARSRGYSGLRVTGDASWVDAAGWRAFLDYEADVTSAFAGLRIVGLCTYDVARVGHDVEEITCRHSFAFRPAPPGAAPAVLADVLRAGVSGRVPSEADWARLVRAAGLGDELALHELYDRAHRPVFALALRLSGSREAAEELTLEVFEDVFRHASRYDRSEGPVLAWIMILARARAIDRQFDRRKRRTPETAFPASTAGGGPALRRRVDRLKVALGKLRPEVRDAMEAVFFSEQTHDELAARSGSGSEPLRAGLDAMRRALEGDE